MAADLFSPLSINGVTLPNRFVRSATWEGMCDEQGRATVGLVDLYRQLARGGVGLIISGYSYVRADGKQLPGKMAIDDDALLPALRELTGAVHDAGALVFCQLVHAGGQTTEKVIGTTPLAPSAVESPNYAAIPREAGAGEIAELVAAFGAAAARARRAGFDGVQLHGAHGYLINQFLSPLTNRRCDAYGGSLENRARFLKEVCAAVREEVGPDYPVTIKLTASDNLEGGFGLEEAVAVAKMLQQWSIDAIEVSSGTAASGALSPVRTGIATAQDEAYNADFARAVKAAVDVPVMTVGGLRSCPVMTDLLETGAADLFSLSRPLIREPDLVNTWRRDPGHRATCTSCNGCFRPGLKEGGIYCVLDRHP